MKKLITKLFRFLWPEKKGVPGIRTDKPVNWTAYKKSLPPLEEWPILNQVADELDKITPTCHDIIQGAFDRAYGPGTVEPVYVSRETLNKPLTPNMVPHPELPRCCPQCYGPLMLSKKDNRVCACRPCGMMYLTKEANQDPNIQADITHGKAGIVLKEMTTNAVDILKKRYNKQKREKLEDENEI